MGKETNADNFDEIANTARAELIAMNKARMELLRHLYNSDEDMVVNISEMGNGRAILEKKSTPLGNMPNKIFTIL